MPRTASRSRSRCQQRLVLLPRPRPLCLQAECHRLSCRGTASRDCWSESSFSSAQPCVQRQPIDPALNASKEQALDRTPRSSTTSSDPQARLNLQLAARCSACNWHDDSFSERQQALDASNCNGKRSGGTADLRLNYRVAVATAVRRLADKSRTRVHKMGGVACTAGTPVSCRHGQILHQRLRQCRVVAHRHRSRILLQASLTRPCMLIASNDRRLNRKSSRSCSCR